MSEPPARFKRIAYKALNSRQKENFNFQKVSAVLADYGFATLRLSDDWQGADFIANHVSGEYFLKVQLKGRFTVDKKYGKKDIWICFNDRETDIWYLVPHDTALSWALSNLNIGTTKSWIGPRRYSWPTLSRRILSWLSDYALIDDTTRTAQQAVIRLCTRRD